jgi:uncharacterized repeat protein (TIGR01451 family)
LIAVSNCFNVLSNSPKLPEDDTQQITMATTSQIKPGFSAPRTADNRLYAIGRESLMGARAELVTRASAFSPLAPSITATKSHTPPGNANPGDTLTYTVVIANSGTTDATGVNFTDTIDPNTTLVGGSVIASPIAVDDSYHTIGNVNISVPAGQGVIANDTNPNGPGTLTVTKVNSTPVPNGGSATTSTANGSVTMSSDGSFSYNPNVAFRGPTDNFTYTLGNGTGKTDTATVTIAVNGLIWFVNVAAAPGGDGRLSSPFNCLVGPGCFDPVAADTTNDNIFVYSGAYTGGLALLNGERLIGQGAGDTLINITGLAQPSGTNMLPTTGGANPTIVAAGANITLASGNTIRGVSINGTAPAAVDLIGTGFGTVTIAETALDGVGQALNLTSGTLSGPVASTAAFTSVSSLSSSTTGISLTGVSGNMSSGSTTVTSSSGIGISVGTSSAALNFGNTTSTLSGGAGVSLTTNTGAITFGTLNISPLANQRGLLATDNSATLTSTSGAITTTGATSVEITRSVGTTPLNVTLTSVSTSSSAPNGIYLSNTGGSFTVVGTGAANSGGTISNTVGADGAIAGSGVYLNNAADVSLSWMHINNHPNWAIRGVSVTDFELLNSTIDGANGTSTPLQEGSISFSNLLGTATISNSTMKGGVNDNITIVNTSGSLNLLTITGCTIRDNHAASGNDGLHVEAQGTATMTVKVGTLASPNTFAANRGDHIEFTTQTTTSTGTFVCIGNTFSGGHPAALGQGITVQGIGDTNYNISNNTMSGSIGTAVNVVMLTGDSKTFSGTIANNSIGTTGVLNSGSAQGSDIVVELNGDGIHNSTVSGNTLRQYGNGAALLLQKRNSSSAASALNVTVTGNTITQPGSFASNGVLLNSGTVAGNAGTSCTDIGGAGALANNFTGSGAGGSDDFRVRQRFSTTVRLPGYAGANTDTTAVVNFIKGRNSAGASGSATTQAPGGGFIGGAPCTPGVMPTSVGPSPETFSTQSAGPKEDRAADVELGRNVQALHGKHKSDDNVSDLTQEELDGVVRVAIQRWLATGISAQELSRLQAMSFKLAALSSYDLATPRAGGVLIDKTAMGYGWFVDPTPYDDREFEIQTGATELQASESSAAFGRVDLLTVVMRALGYGLDEGNPLRATKRRGLMQGTLDTSVRRLPVSNILGRSSKPSPGAQSVDLKASAPAWQPKTDSSRSQVDFRPAVFYPGTRRATDGFGRNARRLSYATSARRNAVFIAAPFSGETVNLNIGTIPPGKSVTIMFSVTINSPLPNGVCSVTNQGHVTGSNFSQVDTNSDATPVNKAVAISACPANIATNTDAGVCTAVVTYASPTGDGCPTPTVTCNPPSGFAFAKGTTTVTCTATNGNPPDATCSFTVTVNDNQPPAITCPANVTQGTDPGQCSALVTYPNATATDNCPGVGAPVCTPASGSIFAKGTTTVNCTVSDASSNSASCSFTVTVNDTTPPTITCPASVIQSTDLNQCSAAVTYANATATDNCPGVGTPVCTPTSGSTFAKGTTTVNCTVSDASGNPANCSFTVTVNDTQAPSITCPSNVTQSTDSNLCSAVVTYSNATATDNCPGVGTPVCTPTSGSTFAKGSTTVNCTVSDASGNSASCSFTVTINDMQAPTITCPGNVAQGTDAGQCTAVVNYANATASDNCPGVGTPACSPASGSVFNKGTTTVTCIVSDASTNSASCSFTVTVNDMTPPTITCPANVIQSTDPNRCTAVVTYPNATASDSCSGVGTPVCSPSSGSTFAKGVTTVTCTVSDASGNPASCSFTVTVKDTQAPNLSPCPSDITVTSGGGCQVVTYTSPTATDNCGSATVNCSPPSGTCFPAGTTTVTCTASDTSPDSPDTSCSFRVTVVPCAITCPSNISRGNDPGQCGASVTYSANTNGGCGTTICSPASGSFFPVGTTTVVCTTTAGPSCSFTVTVNDTEGPHITVTTQPIELWPPNHKYHTITMSDLVASATDNCSGNLINSVVIASVSSDELENSGGDGNTLNDIVIAANCKSVQLRAERDGGGNGRVYTIVLKVTDGVGNVGTASRTVTVPLSQGSGPAILGPGPGYTVTSSCP